MIKFNKEKIKFIIFGRKKDRPLMKARVAVPEKEYKYKVKYKIRFPYKYNHEEHRMLFLPITLSAFYFGLRTKFSNRLTPSEIAVIVDRTTQISGNFLLTQPFTIEKLNKSNVEYEERTITVVTKQELEFVEFTDKRDDSSRAFEIFDVEIKQILN